MYYLIDTDKKYIIGVDEVGRGSCAGPICVCAVRAEKNWFIDGLNDSKQLTDFQRRVMNDKLMKLVDLNEISFGIAQRNNEEIDKNGLSHSLYSCFAEVSEKLYTGECLIIIDGNLNLDKWLGNKDYKSIIKADTKIPSVMAASIIAKVFRDDLMIKLHDAFPCYGWNTSMGYITKKHIESIKKYGYSSYHRKSYKIKGLND